MFLPQTMIVTPEWVAGQDPLDWLTAREQAFCDTADSMRRRAERRAGRMAVKCLLYETFGLAPLNGEIGTDGLAPVLVGWTELPDILISLSHSAGLGAASWAWAVKEGTVGVDAQQIRPTRQGLSNRVLTPAEQAQADQSSDALLLFWALKEAATKARRMVWGRALREIVVVLDAPGAPHGTACITISGEPPMAAWYEREGDWWVARAVRPAP